MTTPSAALPDAAPARRVEGAFAGMFTGVFLALGAQMAFLQLWYEENGLSEAQIGYLNTIAFGARIVAGILLPAAAGRAGRPGAAIAVFAILGAAAAAAHLVAPPEFAWVTPLSVALAIAFAGILPLGDAACWAAAERLGFSYRRPRAVGSFAFLAATFGVGVLLPFTGVDGVALFIAAALLIGAVGGAAASGAIDRRAEPLQPRPALWDGLRLLGRRDVALAVLAASSVQASHAVFYVYGSIHWRSLGFSDPMIGALWAWGVLAEIGLFFLGGGLIGRLGAGVCLALGGAVAAVRWTCMAFDPGVAGAFALQTLHAGSFALSHLAIVAFISAAAPPALAGAAQGVVSAAAGGVAMMAATMLAAAAYPAFGGGAYLVGTGAALLGVGAAVALRAARG